MFNESNIGGHDYLRNLVHLPFFLQNSGLRKGTENNRKIFMCN